MSMSKNDKIKKSGRKPAVVHLTVRTKSEEYVLGTLSFNTVKQEFSYHFSYPVDAPKMHLDCDTGIQTERIDHITWHQYIAHIKRGDVPIERIEISPGPLFCEKPVITPFYVESLYFSDADPCLRRVNQFKPWKGSQTQLILDVIDSQGFSIIYVLAPSMAKTADLLIGLQFLEVPKGLEFPPCLVDLCDEQHRAGRIKLWNDWDLVIIASPYTCRIKSSIPDEIGKSYRLPNYKNVPSALTDLLMQANNLKKGR